MMFLRSRKAARVNKQNTAVLGVIIDSNGVRRELWEDVE